MATNPFEGTPFADSWQNGFAAGFLLPDATPGAPLVLEPEQQQAYDEGVLSGRELALLGVNMTVTSTSENSFAETAGHIAEGIHAVGDIVHIVHAGRTLGITAGAIATGWAAFWGIVLFAVIGPNRSIPFFDEAAAQLFSSLLAELEALGVSGQHLEIFMAACDRSEHEVNQQDPMAAQGWWHGALFQTFEQALAEAQSHGHPENTRVLRFQTATPSLVEMISLPQ